MPPLPEALRQAVFFRDDWMCRACGNRRTLDPHHVIYRSHGGKDELNNLLILCRRCHDDEHEKRLRIEIITVLSTDLDVKFWRTYDPRKK